VHLSGVKNTDPKKEATSDHPLLKKRTRKREKKDSAKNLWGGGHLPHASPFRAIAPYSKKLKKREKRLPD